jgi:hypothetical protein
VASATVANFEDDLGTGIDDGREAPKVAVVDSPSSRIV